MNMKQQQRVQSAQLPPKNSRQKDNHYDEKVHNKAWIAPGTGIYNKLPQYEHLDSGLVILPKKTTKLKYRELSEINDQLEKLQSTSEFRNFKEFENVQNGELVVTVEYCTNCQQHQGSTRHDEEKYFRNATSMKEEIIGQYPMAKVYLKPLIYDPHDQSIDSMYIQRRIGAFEVQVASRNQDQLKKGVIFSKLKSKQWPNYQDVVQGIVAYLNTSPVEIYVTFPEGVTGNLNNIEIALVAAHNTQRPASSMSRSSRQTQRTNKPERKILARTNEKGIVKLDAVPIDIYTIEVQESNDYQAESFLFNMMEMFDTQMTAIIQLRKQTHSYLEIQVYHQQNPISNAKVSVLHLQSHETMIAKEVKSGVYDATLEPGQYQILVQKQGMKENQQTITCQCGVNRVNIEMEQDPNGIVKPPPSAKVLQPVQQVQQQGQRSQSGTRPASASKSQSQVSLPSQNAPQMEFLKQEDQNPRPVSGYKTTIVFLYDPYTNQPIEGVAVKLNEESTKKSTTYITDKEGTCKLILQNVLEGKLVISHDGYFQIIEEYGTTQNKMNLYQLRELSFPLIKQPDDLNSVQIMVQTNVEAMPIDLKLILPDNVQIDNSHQYVDYDFNEESGCLRITINDLTHRKGIFRIIADIIEPECLHPQMLKLYIISQKELKLVDVPKTPLPTHLYWDIGVICAPNTQFLEINTPTSEVLDKDKYLKDYQKLLQFLKNSKNMDIKTLLGFNDKEKLELSGDILVQKEKIHQSLEKYGFQTIQNLDYLIQSAMMSNGLYSFKKLEQKLNIPEFEFIFDVVEAKEAEEESDDEPYDDDYDI